MITDKLTKYGYFILYKKVLLAEDVAYTFYKYIVKNYELSKEIIFDQDTLFTSKFWKSLIDLVDIKHNFSISYHPQTDNQTEKLN